MHRSVTRCICPRLELGVSFAAAACEWCISGTRQWRGKLDTAGDGTCYAGANNHLEMTAQFRSSTPFVSQYRNINFPGVPNQAYINDFHALLPNTHLTRARSIRGYRSTPALDASQPSTLGNYMTVLCSKHVSLRNAQELSLREWTTGSSLCGNR